MTITLEEFKKGKIAINTRTQEEYDNLMNFFDNKGIDWGGGKASEKNHFNTYKEKTCITIWSEKKKQIAYSDIKHHKNKPSKIITPNELKEYNEFMAKPKYITTHAELLKLHGRSVTCKIEGEYVDDAKICVGGQPKHDIEEMICICCSMKKRHGIASPQKLLGYKQAIWISLKCSKYEYDNRKCTEIKLKEETQYLTIGQAIDYMLESQDNVVEYSEGGTSRYRERIVDGEKEISHDGESWGEDIDPIFSWTNIKKWEEKHIEEPKKTIKELIQAKEKFQYKNNWYRFNKDGAVIDSVGGAIGIDKIIELLKQ